METSQGCKHPKISREVLDRVDQLHAKIMRINAELNTQERLSRALEVELKQLQRKDESNKQDLQINQQLLTKQKKSHFNTVQSTQNQAIFTDQFQNEYQQKKKEKKNLLQLIERQKEQLIISQGQVNKQKKIHETYAQRCKELLRIKDSLIQKIESVACNIQNLELESSQVGAVNNKIINELNKVQSVIEQ